MSELEAPETSLSIAHLCAILDLIKGCEFLRKVQRIAKAKDLTCVFVPGRGKGSHGTLYLGSRFTVLKDRKKEIGPGLLRAMCKDLGIEPKDL